MKVFASTGCSIFLKERWAEQCRRAKRYHSGGINEASVRGGFWWGLLDSPRDA